jgi:glycosyltransferase involved in cell wall biosynthesis
VSAHGPRILIGTVEVPTVGGSATASHDLFHKMRADGRDVVYETFQADDAAALLRRIDPEVVLGVGFIAALLLKQADPNRRTVFLTGTCRQAQDYVTSGRARDAISLARELDQGTIRARIVNGSERRAVDLCDLIVTHSPLTFDMFARFFPGSMGKVYPRPISFAPWICEGSAKWRAKARPFAERDIDVLFVASNWARAEKSYPMVHAIAKRLAPLSVHIVGAFPSPVASATHHGFVASREPLFELYGRARAVACASHMDAAPGILFEAAAMGCNVVASRNCGNWNLCHPDLLADPFGPEAFAVAIRRAVDRTFDDHLGTFLEPAAYDEFMSLLTAFAQPFAPQTM